MIKDQQKNSLLPLVGIICATVVALGAIGAWVYVQNQSIAQKNKELEQQKVLKESELKTQRENAKTQADAQKDAARCASSDSVFACL